MFFSAIRLFKHNVGPLDDKYDERQKRPVDIADPS
jgi:hypothetical protein